jgi:hypothetical protein
MQSTYLSLAMRTNSSVVGTHDHVSADMLHATLGLADELFEYQMSQSWLNAVEELGDLCWFIALAAKELNTDPFESLERFKRFNPQLPVLAEAVAEFVGLVKKSYAYGAPLDVSRLSLLLSSMLIRIEAIAEVKSDRSLDELLTANIAKLQARYPDKFTAQAALTRNIPGEARALKMELGTML